MLTEIERIALRRRLAEWAKDSMPSYTIIGNDAYERPVLFSTAREWLPDESLDDCRPLLAEIGRRELWPRFVVALRKVAPKPFYMRRTRYFLHLTPAQITAAVTKLMEENP